MKPDSTLIAAKTMFPGDELRVELSPFRGQTYLGIRRYFNTQEGAWLPGRKGISLRVGILPQLVDWLQQAESLALLDGLLCEEDYELADRPIPDLLLNPSTGRAA